MSCTLQSVQSIYSLMMRTDGGKRSCSTAYSECSCSSRSDAGSSSAVSSCVNSELDRNNSSSCWQDAKLSNVMGYL